jgi:hypothetical protein
MRTEELIAALAADTTPGPRAERRLALGLAAALVLALAALLGFWGPRADLAAALSGAALAKTLLPLSLGATALWLAADLCRPEAVPRRQRAALALLGAVAAAAFGVALWQGGGAALATEMGRSSLWTCLESVPALALLPLGAVLWALRAGAPAHPARAGAVAGLAAGGLGAAIYSLYCDQDALLFYLPAYGAGIALVTLAGALLGARLLRW